MKHANKKTISQISVEIEPFRQTELNVLDGGFSDVYTTSYPKNVVSGLVRVDNNNANSNNRSCGCGCGCSCNDISSPIEN